MSERGTAIHTDTWDRGHNREIFFLIFFGYQFIRFYYGSGEEVRGMILKGECNCN